MTVGWFSTMLSTMTVQYEYEHWCNSLGVVAWQLVCLCIHGSFDVSITSEWQFNFWMEV